MFTAASYCFLLPIMFISGKMETTFFTLLMHSRLRQGRPLHPHWEGQTVIEAGIMVSSLCILAHTDLVDTVKANYL